MKNVFHISKFNRHSIKMYFRLMSTAAHNFRLKNSLSNLIFNGTKSGQRSFLNKSHYCNIAVIDDNRIENYHLNFVYNLLNNADQLKSLNPNVLSSNPDDHILVEIKESDTIDEVFDIAVKHSNSLSFHHACQMVFTLSHIRNSQKFHYKNSKLHEALTSNFHSLLASNPSFQHILSLIDCNLDMLNDKLPAIMMSVDNIGLAYDHNLMVNLYLRNYISASQMDLSSLTQLSFVFNSAALRAYPIASPMLSALKSLLDKSHLSEEDLVNIALIFLNFRKLISHNIYLKYLNFIEKILSESDNCLQKSHIILILYVIFKYKFFSKEPVHLAKKLMALVENDIKELSALQIVTLNSLLLYITEPKKIIYKVQECAVSLLNTYDASELKTDLLLCMIYNMNYKGKCAFQSYINEEIEKFNNYKDISSLFYVIRHLSLDDNDMHHKFWQKAFSFILNDSENPISKYEKISCIIYLHSKYMFSQYSFFGSLKDKEFVKSSCSFLKQELDTSGFILPENLAHIIGILIGYSDEELPQAWLDLIESYLNQFSPFDIVYLSKGIKLRLRHSYISKADIAFITKAIHLLDRATESLVPNVKSLRESSPLHAAYEMRHGVSTSHLLEQIDKANMKFSDEINAAQVHYVAKNYRKVKYNNSDLFNGLAHYVTNSEKSLMSSVLYQLLSCFYNVGFTPTNVKEFSTACRNIIEEDCFRSSSLLLLSSCLCLAWYKCLSPALIHYIFSTKFLDQVDQEMDKREIKKSSSRLRSLLMQLNRAVCLDYPEEKIPWFHEGYCRDFSELSSPRLTAFHDDVHDVLASLLGDRNYISSITKSPYHYHIDFEFVLNWEGKPVSIPDQKYISPENKSLYKRIVVLLQSETRYSINDNSLGGFSQLRRRHLEILGYAVVEIPHFTWNSMAVGTHNDKLNIIKDLIYEELSNTV